MAAIPVTIVGTLTYSGLEIGGGPIIPPAGGGAPVYPAHPIYLPPAGGGTPPIGAHPEHPIYFPPPPAPEGPPTGDGRWGWVQPPGVWVWVPADAGKPHPIP